MKRELINIVSEVQGVENSVDVHSRGLTNYLSKLDLPTENVLVSPDERMVVINNVPNIVLKIDSKIRKQSMYISKFIAACGAGLFDAALNFYNNMFSQGCWRARLWSGSEHHIPSLGTKFRKDGLSL